MTSALRFLTTGLLIFALHLDCSHTDWDHASTARPLRQAHAHNDYEHPRPLFDALEHGFTSIEADIHVQHNSLYVAHDPEDIVAGRTLQHLYLDPLFELHQKHSGPVQPGWPTFYLMIDIKTDADSAYRVLSPALSAYADMLTVWHDHKKTKGAVTIILSGNRPIDMVRQESTRLVAIDGRLEDLQNGAPAALFPWVSESWTSLFTWRGVGEIPADEWEKLAAIVQTAHTNSRLVRFWSTDYPAPSARRNMWNVLYKAHVDLINTDDLAGLAAFLNSAEQN